MSFEVYEKIAKMAMEQSRHLKFDELKIVITESHRLAIRVALGAVSRENIASEDLTLSVFGVSNKRHKSLSLDPCDLDTLKEKIAELYESLQTLSEDKEFVLLSRSLGSYEWCPDRNDFYDTFNPEDIYESLEKNIKPIREQGLRVSGFIQGFGMKQKVIYKTGFELYTQDNNLSYVFTVDHPTTLASGVGRGSILHADKQVIEKKFSEALNYATYICKSDKDKKKFATGDYTVILSANAVNDFLSMILAYGLLDKRKIDEGRTHLSGCLNDYKFSKGLDFYLGTKLSHDQGVYETLPFNQGHVKCEDLHYILNGSIQGFDVSSYWALEKGLSETHSRSKSSIQLSFTNNDQIELYDNLEHMIANTKKGVFVNSLWYLRMVSEMQGITTGMTRDGVFEIENGKIVRSLNNMRWHENPFRVLSAISGATRKRDLFGSSYIAGQDRGTLGLCPALRIENFHFSSVSDY